MHTEYNDTIKTSDTILLEKYIPLILSERFVCERELETEQNSNILTPHSYGHQRCVFLVFQGCSTGGPGVHSAVCVLSLPHLHQRASKLPDFLFLPSYIIVQPPAQYLWNGMFDRHQAEITVIQFTGHSLPVHQSMTVLWDFNLSHIVNQNRLHDFFPGSKVNLLHYFLELDEEEKDLFHYQGYQPKGKTQTASIQTLTGITDSIIFWRYPFW